MKKSANTGLNISVFVCGSGTLALEILASRYMVPSFGTSIFIWGAVLSVTLFYLALGYRWGGKLTNRINLLSRRLSLHILYASAWIGLIPAFGPSLLLLGLELGAVAGPIFVALFLLGPPLVLLSTAVPLAIGIIDARKNGKVRASLIAGNLFALSTVGSIFGALLTAYYLLPSFGVGRSFFIICLGLIALALPGFANMTVRKTAVCVVFFLSLTKLTIEPPELKMGLQFLDRRATPYGQIDVLADHRDNSRILLLDGASQNHVGGVHWDKSRFEYINIINRKAALLLPSKPSKETSLLGFTIESSADQASSREPAKSALILGLGAGTMAKNLNRIGYQVDCVEIDQNVLSIAEQFFAFNKNSDAKVHISDARAFLVKALQEEKNHWDLIILDLAGGGIHPEHVYTLEAYQAIQALLKPKGLLIVNFVSYVTPPHDQVIKHSAATLARVFSDIQIYTLYPDKDDRGAMGQALVFASSFPMEKKFFSADESKHHLVNFDRNLRPLSDDWNPMGNWSVHANAEWHQNIAQWLGSGVLVPH